MSRNQRTAMTAFDTQQVASRLARQVFKLPREQRITYLADLKKANPPLHSRVLDNMFDIWEQAKKAQAIKDVQSGPITSLIDYFKQGLQIIDDWFGPAKPRPTPVPPTPVPPTPPAPPPPPPEPTEQEKVEKALFEAHNAKRKEHGKKLFTQSDLLLKVARDHAKYQADHKQMGHFLGDGSPFKRIQEAGYNYSNAGENVAWNQANVDEVMTSWMWSPGHRWNILGGYEQCGCSMARSDDGQPYWSVAFGTPSSGKVKVGLLFAGQDSKTVIIAPHGQLCVPVSTFQMDIPE